MPMNYHGNYRSNDVSADTHAVRELLDERYPEPGVSEEDFPLKWNVDGDVHVDHDAGVVWFGSTETTFAVWDYDFGEEVTRGFLEHLSEHIEEPMVIRSVGHTGNRHIPDAWQWVVMPDGTVEYESMQSVSGVMES